jgi:hypothetical protein
MGCEDLHVYDHKALSCPINTERRVDAWRGDYRLVLMTIDSPVDFTTANIIGSASISIPLYDFNKPFHCPGCIGNGCKVVLESAVDEREIVRAFQRIKITPVP